MPGCIRQNLGSLAFCQDVELNRCGGKACLALIGFEQMTNEVKEWSPFTRVAVRLLGAEVDDDLMVVALVGVDKADIADAVYMRGDP